MVSKIDRLMSSFIDLQEEHVMIKDEIKVLQFHYLEVKKRVDKLLKDQQDGRQEKL